MKFRKHDNYHAVSGAYTVCVNGRIPMILKYVAYYHREIIDCCLSFKLAAAACDEHREGLA